MSFSDTPQIPYKDRDFIIDDTDKDLFIKMKSIVDSGFPEATHPMMIELYKELWEKHKGIRYVEMGDSRIFIHFPKLNPIVRLIGSIAMRFTKD